MKASLFIAKYLETKNVKYCFELVGGMITHILDNAAGKTTLNEILSSTINDRTVDEFLIEKVSSIGEKISLRRMQILNGKYIGFYIHNSTTDYLGKIGVAVSLSSNNLRSA